MRRKTRKEPEQNKGQQKPPVSATPSEMPQDVGKAMENARAQREKKERMDACLKEVNEVLENYGCELVAEPVADPKQVIGVLQQLFSARPFIVPKQ